MPTASTSPLSIVMGDVDMVRALGIAGIRSAFLGPPEAPARFSRHVSAALPWIDQWRDPDAAVAALLGFARAQREPPVLYPQTDAALLLTSRHREALAGACRFALADPALIEQLVDKGRFQDLARRHDLPVPPAQRLRPSSLRVAPELDLSFPFVVKPAVRVGTWHEVANDGKAMHLTGPAEWAAAWPRLANLPCDVIVQQLVPGPETAIESYHAYIDTDGATAGEFTGRKIRTFPSRYGFSTAVEVCDVRDVRELGRDVLSRLGLRGVAKVDFKRDPGGRLHLLEINPRFNLWHYPAAIAGVNLPALVYADLIGARRPAIRRARGTVSWCTPLTDLRAAHGEGMSVLAWLRWVRRCEVRSGLSRQDPMPFVRGMLWRALWSRIRRA
ncbi:MAG: carboxylate--amine ligase [Solirubrobacteraceae bacterium]